MINSDIHGMRSESTSPRTEEKGETETKGCTERKLGCISPMAALD